MAFAPSASIDMIRINKLIWNRINKNTATYIIFIYITKFKKKTM